MQSRKPDYSKMQGRPEVGVSIQVGIITSGGEGEAAESSVPEADYDNVEGGGVYIEAPFDDDVFGGDY